MVGALLYSPQELLATEELMSSIATKVRVPVHVRSVIDEDGAVLLDVRKGTYFSLNNVGVEVWRRLEAGLTLGQIEEAIAADFAAPADVVSRDVQQFVRALEGKALLHVEQ
jgi:hypothetical protein